MIAAPGLFLLAMLTPAPAYHFVVRSGEFRSLLRASAAFEAASSLATFAALGKDWERAVVPVLLLPAATAAAAAASRATFTAFRSFFDAFGGTFCAALDIAVPASAAGSAAGSAAKYKETCAGGLGLGGDLP